MKYRLITTLLGHAGFGATNQMVDLAEDMTEEEREQKVDWWGKSEGRPLEDYRDICSVDVDEIEFETTPEQLALMKKALDLVLEAANNGDEMLVGGVTYTIEEAN